MDNLSLYNQLRVVPEEAKKPITAGRLKGMTDINPVWRIKALTEAFGPCGVGWWYTVDNKELVHDAATNQTAALVDITLYYVDPVSGHESKGIPGTGGASFVANEKNGPYMSDECYKMALTDALSVAAKSLGLAADVYFSRGCADTKYGSKGKKQTDGEEKNQQTPDDPQATAAQQKPTFQRANIVNEPIGVCSLCNKPLYSPGEGAKKNGVIYCMDCIKAGKV